MRFPWGNVADANKAPSGGQRNRVWLNLTLSAFCHDGDLTSKEPSDHCRFAASLTSCSNCTVVSIGENRRTPAGCVVTVKVEDS
jgi:hypothetical protein